MAKVSELTVLLSGQAVASILRDRNRTLRLTYSDDHVHPGATPLSLSLPPERGTFTGPAVENYLELLLPESRRVRESAAREHGIDPSDPLSLLDVIGLDCAGAVQFCHPQTVEEVTQRVERLEPATDVEYRLADMEMDEDSSWILAEEHWSLPGMQQKFTLREQQGQWFYPRGAAASTHIVKPGIRDLRHQALVEHLTMKAASLLGVDVAHTDYADFGSQRALVVERFDRARDADGHVRRLHQEDLCQALGTQVKYQDLGGPSAVDAVALLRTSAPSAAAAERNVTSFLDGLIFNTVAAAPDAHARNYAILLDGDSVRLAPLYDVATGLAYGTTDDSRRLSMSISGCFDPDAITIDHWKRLADELAIDDRPLLDRLQELRESLPDAFERAASEVEDWDGAVSQVMSRLHPELASRARH